MSAIVCCVCGIEFTVPDAFCATLRETHELFFCPSGHQQHFIGEPEGRKLERKISELSQLAANRAQTIARLERRLRATRAWVTQLKGGAKR